MGDGKVNFNQLSFIQKFNYVKNNLNNRATIKTSDIVNEIVRLSQDNQQVNLDGLPEGFKIIKTTPNNVKMNTSSTDIPTEVYDTPNIPDLPDDVIKFADTLNELLENIDTLPSEFKEITINVLTEFLNGILLETIENVYDTPNTPPADVLEIIENVYDTPDIKENFEKALRALLPDVTNLSSDIKNAIVKLVQSMLEKLNHNEQTGITKPKTNSNQSVQTKKTPTEIYHKYGNIVKVYNYSGQLLRTEPYNETTHGTFD